MSYGKNVIQVAPLFCPNKNRFCKASNFFDDLKSNSHGQNIHVCIFTHVQIIFIGLN